MIELSDYKKGDESAVYRLVETVLAEYGLEMDPLDTDADLQDINESYIKKDGRFRVLRDGDRIVGSYGLYPISEHICELRKMYLYREFRGRGLGKKMMKEALNQARKAGFRLMVLETNEKLVEAIALYRTFGFVEYLPPHLSCRCNMAMKREI